MQFKLIKNAKRNGENTRKKCHLRVLTDTKFFDVILKLISIKKP